MEGAMDFKDAFIEIVTGVAYANLTLAFMLLTIKVLEQVNVFVRWKRGRKG